MYICCILRTVVDSSNNTFVKFDKFPRTISRYGPSNNRFLNYDSWMDYLHFFMFDMIICTITYSRHDNICFHSVQCYYVALWVLFNLKMIGEHYDMRCFDPTGIRRHLA
jgi:hypothetical protein